MIKRFFLRIRFYNRIISAFWQKRKRLVILGFLIGIAAFFLIYHFLNLKQEKIEKIGLVGKFTLNELPLEIQRLISDGLTQVSNDGSPQPSLAVSWEIKNDGKEYFFTLKDDLFWQDGKPVLATDISLHFSDVATLVVDQKTIKFQLKEAFSPFPVVASRPIFKKGLIGTGEYKVKSIKRNGEIIEKLVLVPVKDKTKAQKIFRFYPTEETARIGFKLGEVNQLEEIVLPEDLSGWKNVEVSPEIKEDRFVAVYFNTDYSQLGDKATRQALAYAIEKKFENRALNSFNPASWAYNKDVKPYEYDLENAKKLLESQNDSETQEPLKEIELSTFSSLLSTAEEIKKDWEALGITTKIKVVSFPSEDFQALLATQEIPSDPDQYLFWHSTQTTNISHYKSPKLDKLLEDGRKNLNQEERKTIYLDFQRFLVEDTPVAFLFHPTVYNLSKR
jgi:peptide/nickel transport system substrate-binding protein